MIFEKFSVSNEWIIHTHEYNTDWIIIMAKNVRTNDTHFSILHHEKDGTVCELPQTFKTLKKAETKPEQCA